MTTIEWCEPLWLAFVFGFIGYWAAWTVRTAWAERGIFNQEQA